MQAHTQANRTTANNLDLPKAQQLALFAGDEQMQAKRLEQLRANAIAEAKRQRGRRAAEWQANAFDKLDKAFLQGFLQGGQRPAGQTANDQSLDFDEFEQREEDVLQEVRFNLSLVDDIVNAGFTVDSSLARTVYVRERESQFQVEGERSMDGRARADNDDAVLEIYGVPLPIAHVDYEISARKQQQSQNFGEDVETRKARQAGRILRETEEFQMLDGWGSTVPDSRGNSLEMYGYRDSEVNLSGSVAGDWTTASNVLDTIDNFLNEMESQTTENNRGPDPENAGAWLYYHPNQRSDLRQADPRGDGNMSLRQRIEQDYPYLDLRAVGALDDGEVIMVAQDQRFVEIVNAQSPTNMSEDVDMGLATQYKALSCRVPFIQTTYDGIAGVVRGTGA
jgi:hypothetical protein